jgi:hypothetical protein
LVNLFWNNSHSTVEVAFDEGVSPPCEDLPSEYICLESHPSISTVGSFDLRDTVLYPVPGDNKVKRYTQQLQVEDIDELKFLYKLHRYRSQKICHPYKWYGFWDTLSAELYKVAGGLQLLWDTQERIDLPSREYRKSLRANWIKCLDEQKEPEFFNCYCIRPVRKRSLLFNQQLNRVCFSDITTYYSPPYDYTRTNKDPSKRLVIRGKAQYSIVKRRQAKEFFYLKERPHKTPQWSKFKIRRSERNWTYHKNLQGPYILRDGRDGNNTIVPRPTPKWYFRSDKETKRLFRLLDPKPVEVPDPVHPSSVNADYPAILKVFFRREYLS